MPRGVPRDKETKRKDNILKTNKAEDAKRLKLALEDIKSNIEADLIRDIGNRPACDLAYIQMEYKACLRIMGMLQSVINDGVRAEHQLNEED